MINIYKFHHCPSLLATSGFEPTPSRSQSGDTNHSAIQRSNVKINTFQWMNIENTILQGGPHVLLAIGAVHLVDPGIACCYCWSALHNTKRGIGLHQLRNARPSGLFILADSTTENIISLSTRPIELQTILPSLSWKDNTNNHLPIYSSLFTITVVRYSIIKIP